MVAVSSVQFQWIIASILLVCRLISAVYYLRAVDEGADKKVASPAIRKATYTDLLRESPRLSSFETSEFLLNATIDLYERKHAAMTTLDDKAQKLIALIGGGSLFALLENSRRGSTLSGSTLN